MAVYTSKHASVVFKDATGSPITYTASPTEMDVAISGVEQNGCEAIRVMNNGTFFELVEGAQKMIPFSITIKQDGKLVDAGTGKPFNAITKAGTFSAGVTGDPGSTGGVWTIYQIVITLTRNAVTSTITLTNVRLIGDIQLDPAGNVLKISGEAHGTGSVLPFVIS